ncbi:54S ribosomal protein L17 mitochondrial [Apophysomyces sp. BC1034]|nr:54S ribosomal protein L17 mitochondrial [Apophysomyces sp. BC1015]KAG0176604.1 54S ribosomal protein L17 mitochondrial [Apophysomyces sp. BC1021]KAG0188200.1 54S ribosomal protein L17 mitochondrial [Apophysomyces sp. BC1034]
MFSRANHLTPLAKRWFATTAPTPTPLVVKSNRICASVILSRAPQITRDSTAFEQAYFDYKEKLDRQSAAAFPTDFYFKKGSVAERRWKEEEAARQAAMKDFSKSLTEVTAETHERLKGDKTIATTMNVVEKASRETEADQKKDVKSLDRSLQRTLYLVLHKPNDAQNPWQFPQGQLESNEYLHEAAERRLKEECGPDMDVWFVGRQPITFYKQAAAKNEDTTGSKVFFMKARVYGGQVQPSKDVKNFAWLTKEELADYLSEDYYKAIKDSLGDL